MLTVRRTEHDVARNRGILALLLGCRITTAQVATARLEGMPQDMSGAALPGAKVSVVNDRTEVRVETSVSPEGRFAFPSLQPSVYTLSVEAAGFRKAVVSNLQLNVSDSVYQIVKMEVGNVATEVPEIANRVPHFVMSWDEGERKLTSKQVHEQLQAGDPPIYVLQMGPGKLMVSVWMMKADEHRIVARRLKDILTAA